MDQQSIDGLARSVATAQVTRRGATKAGLLAGLARIIHQDGR
jgi:hypothetical protein